MLSIKLAKFPNQPLPPQHCSTCHARLNAKWRTCSYCKASIYPRIQWIGQDELIRWTAFDQWEQLSADEWMDQMHHRIEVYHRQNDLMDAYEERAAIMEYDGRLTREDAEVMAANEIFG